MVKKTNEKTKRLKTNLNNRKSFHDFRFYEFQVQGMYYVGGFGGTNYIGWIPAHIYHDAHPRKLLIQNENQ